MKRRHIDWEWSERVAERYIRRRDRVQQREKAIADLKATLVEAAEPIERVVAWLAKRLG